MLVAICCLHVVQRIADSVQRHPELVVEAILHSGAGRIPLARIKECVPGWGGVESASSRRTSGVNVDTERLSYCCYSQYNYQQN